MKRIRALVVALTAAAAIVAGAPPAQAAPTHMAYVLEPHPDDAFQAWSLIERSPAPYKVFILLTQGEEIGFCPGQGLDPGEDTSVRGFPQAQWSAGCAVNRTDSWHRWLDAQAAVDSTVDLLVGMTDHGTVTHSVQPGDATPVNRVDPNKPGDDYVTRNAHWWVGPNSARVMFNLGDGDLTSAETLWALRSVGRVQLRSDPSAPALPIPDLPSYEVVGAAYRNIQSGCYQYPHSDHTAVHEMLATQRLGLGHQYAPTCRLDPDRVRTNMIDDDVWAFNMAADGRFQYYYGWLASDSWPAPTVPNQHVNSQEQTFWDGPLT